MAVFSRLPRFYPILDAGLLLRAGVSMEQFARELHEAGIRFLQYRDKEASDTEVLRRASALRKIFPASDCCLILNDRVFLAQTAQVDGIHVGQADLPVAEVRSLMGKSALVGLSTHTPSELLAGESSSADYLALGPVFTTSSKQNPDPVIGVEGIRSASQRMLAKPLVAIGGISRLNCKMVLDSGAQSVAVISDLLPSEEKSTKNLVQEFIELCASTEA